MSSKTSRSTARTCFPSSTSSSGLHLGLHQQSSSGTTIPTRCDFLLAPTASLHRARPPSFPLLNLIAHRHHRHCIPSPLPRVAGATRTRVRYLDQRTLHCTPTRMAAGTVYRPYHRPRLTWDRLRILFLRRPSFHDLSEPLSGVILAVEQTCALDAWM